MKTTRTIKIVGLLLISSMACMSAFCATHHIETAEQLALIGRCSDYLLTDDYILDNDIDLSKYPNWEPIGAYVIPFAGNFDGKGYTISNLTIYRPREYSIGLFSYSEGNISNLNLEDINLLGGEDVGGLVGTQYPEGKITNSYAVGKVSGKDHVGGLAGHAEGKITNSYAVGKVLGKECVGGLAGYARGEITNSFADSKVLGESFVGGLAGYARGEITNSFAVGETQNYGYCVGGLVGAQHDGEITNSFADSKTKGLGFAGGLVGTQYKGGKITNSFAVGETKGLYGYTVGGLVGSPQQGGGKVINSYWDKNTTKQNKSPGGGTGRSRTKMMQQASYGGWDFKETWSISEGASYPRLSKVPIKITSKQELKALIEDDKFKPRWINYLICNNIDMQDVTIGKLAKEPFSGILYTDDDDVVISNLEINSPDNQEENVGFFAQTKGATISNVRFKNLQVTGKKRVGGLIGHSIWNNEKHTTITDCYNMSGEVKGNTRRWRFGWMESTYYY